MPPHRQTAVDIAKAALQYGNDPERKSLAQDIVGAREITMMKACEDKHAR